MRPLPGSPPRRWLRRFARDERGAISIWSLLLLLTACLIGGFAVDVTHMLSVKTELQVAVDSAAHAAIFRRNNGATADEARTDAVSIASATVPPPVHGAAIRPEDVLFGTYDPDADVFQVDPDEARAVLVVAGRDEERGNPVATFMLRFAGVRTMDVGASAVYVADGDPCARMQGFFAEGAIPTNGITAVSAGFCIHSNSAATFKNKVELAEGAVVSMPDESDVRCSGSDWDKHCPGLRDALRSARYNLEPWLDPIRPPPAGTMETASDLLADVRAALPSWSWPAAGNWSSIRTETGRSLTPTTANLSGRVSYIDCGAGGGAVTLGTTGNGRNLNATYSRVVLLLRNCTVTVDKDVTLVDSIIYTTSQNAQSFKSAGGPNDSMVIGDDRDCDGVGAAALLTRGGLHTAAGLMLNGGFVRALGDVSFAAHFGGKDDSGKGVSIIAGGMIDPRSNNIFTACDPDPDAEPELVTFRLAR